MQNDQAQKSNSSRVTYPSGERATMERSHRLSRLLLNAQEEERGRIARELHDSIGQDLALLVINLQNAAQQAQSIEELGGRVLRLATAAERIGMSVSRVSREIHSSELDLLGLHVAVTKICREFSATYGINARALCSMLPPKIPKDLSLCLYRVVQEALHNVAKHSQAKEVVVELVRDGNAIVLRVEDNGHGFTMDDNFRTGLGLLSMRERVHSLGGKFVIRSRVGGGTRINARVPVVTHRGGHEIA